MLQVVKHRVRVARRGKRVVLADTWCRRRHWNRLCSRWQQGRSLAWASGSTSGLYVILTLRIDNQVAVFECCKFEILVSYFIVEWFVISSVEIVCHGLRPPGGICATGPITASFVRQLFPELFISFRGVQVLSELGHHIAREDAKYVSLVLRKFYSNM